MNEEKQEIITSSNLPVSDFSKFELFLSQYGLPTDNVIAPNDERQLIMEALPAFLNKLPIEARQNARYLSKFIAGSAVGLFDASLNFLWNEIILNLRKKIIIYGVDYFYDEAIGGNLREQYKTDEHLQLVKDQVLLNTCLKLELITTILHKKLCHILDMRNHIGSSHPTEYSINTYELLGWLQTCINDLLLDNISESALTVKSIIDNIKRSVVIIDDESIGHFENSIKGLSSNMVSNLLTSLFGIFVSPTTDKTVQNNILKIASITWKYSTEDIKYDLGKKIDIYKANIDEYKTRNAELFFEKCNGEKYYSNDAKAIKLTLLCEQLSDIHYSWDNFVHETPIARQIMNMIDSMSDIPEIRLNSILKIFLVCRIGNDRSYCEGVSTGASEYYDEFFELLDEEAIKTTISILITKDNQYLLSGQYRPKHVKKIFRLMDSDIISDRLKEMILYVTDYERDLSNVFLEKGFKQISSEIL